MSTQEMNEKHESANVFEQPPSYLNDAIESTTKQTSSTSSVKSSTTPVTTPQIAAPVTVQPIIVQSQEHCDCRTYGLVFGIVRRVKRILIGGSNHPCQSPRCRRTRRSNRMNNTNVYVQTAGAC